MTILYPKSLILFTPPDIVEPLDLSIKLLLPFEAFIIWFKYFLSSSPIKILVSPLIITSIGLKDVGQQIRSFTL